MVAKRITHREPRGAILAQWMTHHHKQNFLYECFEDICKIFAKYDVSFSWATFAPGAWRTLAMKPVRRTQDFGRTDAIA